MALCECYVEAEDLRVDVSRPTIPDKAPTDLEADRG